MDLIILLLGSILLRLLALLDDDILPPFLIHVLPPTFLFMDLLQFSFLGREDEALDLLHLDLFPL